MKASARVTLGLLAAALLPAIASVVPGIFIIAYSGFKEFGIMYGQVAFGWCAAFAVALAHAIILGLPAYFLLHRKNLVFWWTSVLCGFAIGCIPEAILTYPSASPGSGFTFDSVPLIVNGVVTFEGWLSYIKGVIEFGCYGAIGGFAAWYVWRFTESDKDSTKSQKIAFIISILSVVAFASVIAVWGYHSRSNPWPPEDETRRNILGTVVRIELYACEHKSLPLSLNGLPQRKGREDKIVDGWNQPLQYRVADGKMTIFSLGDPANPNATIDKTKLTESYYATREDGSLWVGDDTFWLEEANVKDCPRPEDGNRDEKAKAYCKAFLTDSQKKANQDKQGNSCAAYQ